MCKEWKSISKIVYRQLLSNTDDLFNFVFNEIRLKSLPNNYFPPGKLQADALIYLIQLL